MRPPINLLIVCGPSGVGKGSLMELIFRKHQNAFKFSVSTTTRAPRPDEKDGEHYNFRSVETARSMIAGQQFLEYAEVHDNIYGTEKASVLAVLSEGKTCVLDIDVQGARQLRTWTKNPDVRECVRPFFVFLAPPSLACLEQRLHKRNTETEERIQARLRNAAKEMKASDEVALFDAIIVNETLDQAHVELEAYLELGHRPDYIRPVSEDYDGPLLL